MMRVIRISEMIQRSTIDKVGKASLNLVKSIFYLFFYIHVISCYYWIILGYNSGTRYYRNSETNNYVDYLGNVMVDENNNEIPYNDNIDILYGPFPTF
jgi:hypothetical protein